MPNNDRRGHVRLPLTLYVDSIEISPSVDFAEVTRTTYDLEFTEFDIRKLHAELGKILENDRVVAKRIRFIGRLVS
jgi:hypothetical protein